MNNKKQDCLVAYVDILGYSELVNQENKIVDEIPEIIGECIRLNRGQEHYSLRQYPEIKVIGFSDSILFTLEVTGNDQINNELEHLLKFCSEFQYRLLKRKILIRGGISIGNHKMYNDENITYFNSKALVEAHSIETKAEFPLIEISYQIIQKINVEIKQKYLLKDNFNHVFINYVSTGDAVDKNEIIKFIQEKKFEFIKNDHIRRKYEWLEILVNWSYSKSLNIFNQIF